MFINEVRGSLLPFSDAPSWLFFIFLGVNLNPMSAYIVFGQILFLLIGQGSMIFPPISRRNLQILRRHTWSLKEIYVTWDFQLLVFSQISFPMVNSIANFYWNSRIFSKVKVNHRYQQHKRWLETILNRKFFHISFRGLQNDFFI